MSNGALYAATVLIWGSTWFAIEFQLGVVQPEVSVFYRYAAAAAVLFAWCWLRRLPLRFPARAHALFILLGLCLFSINYVLAYAAQELIVSALTAVAFSTMLWMNMLNARLFFRVHLEGRMVAGAILGVVGVIVLFLPGIRTADLGDSTFVGAALSVAGAFVASLGNMVSQQAQRRALPVVQSNAWGMLYGAGLTALYALSSGTPFAFDTSPGYLLSLVYLALIGSVLAFGAYLTLLGRIGAHRAGYAVVLFPVVAMGLSVAFEGLAVTASMLGGTALVLAGNAMTVGVLRRRPGGVTAAAGDSKRMVNDAICAEAP